jgi:hypothetical protein
MGGVEYCAGLSLAIVGKPWSPAAHSNRGLSKALEISGQLLAWSFNGADEIDRFCVTRVIELSTLSTLIRQRHLTP